MTDAGRAAFARRTEANSGIYSFEGDRADELPEPYAAVHWVTSAKREATRERRLAQLVESSAAGEEVPPLRRS